jgi:hypothetical protein
MSLTFHFVRNDKGENGNLYNILATLVSKTNNKTL